MSANNVFNKETLMNPMTSGSPIILCGFMSSGKTTVGRPLAKKLGYQFLDTDELLVQTYGMTIPEMFQKGGETYFRDLEHEIAKKVCNMTKTVVSTGGGMMTFARNGELLSAHGIVIYLEKDFEECYSRLVLQANRPIVQSKTKEELHQMYEERIALYKKYAAYVIKNHGTIEDAVNQIAATLSDF